MGVPRAITWDLCTFKRSSIPRVIMGYLMSEENLKLPGETSSEDLLPLWTINC